MAKYHADFALLDVKTGKEDLRKTSESGKRTPVTITGYVGPGRPWGRDDGISQEFAIDVTRVEFGKAEKVVTDTLGRPYAKISDLDAGSRVDLDAGFPCMKKRKNVLVRADEYGLFFQCKDGRHYLDGQLGDSDGFLTGVYHHCA